jgi:hypothetical protein
MATTKRGAPICPTVSAFAPREMVCWMNPPYSHGIGAWIKKAYDESRNGAVVVCLIPARTETSWWHRYVINASEIRFIRGRMRFSGHQVNAPFPSALVIFHGAGTGQPRYSTMDRILDEVAA